jgi:hypothetical protein
VFLKLIEENKPMVNLKSEVYVTGESKKKFSLIGKFESNVCSEQFYSIKVKEFKKIQESKPHFSKICENFDGSNQKERKCEVIYTHSISIIILILIAQFISFWLHIFSFVFSFICDIIKSKI